MIGNLRNRWEQTWRRLHIHTPPQAEFDKLIRAYSSAGRFYHNLLHVEDCLSVFDQANSLAAHPEEVELALWFHDAVYDTRRSDNEQRSAEWAESLIEQAGQGKEIAERVSNSILATRHNTEVTDTDAQMVVDIDLSILGREAEVFWRYEENIRKEYAWVPENIFKEERIRILSRFLARRHIYYHEQYREMFEESARLNIAHAIARLSDTSR